MAYHLTRSIKEYHAAATPAVVDYRPQLSQRGVSHGGRRGGVEIVVAYDLPAAMQGEDGRRVPVGLQTLGWAWTWPTRRRRRRRLPATRPTQPLAAVLPVDDSGVLAAAKAAAAGAALQRARGGGGGAR